MGTALHLQEMIDFSYLERGAVGLANAHLAGSMSGHLGAAVMAGYYLGEVRADLDPGVYLGVERDLERIMAGEESIWFSPSKAGVTVDDLFSKPKGDKPLKGDGLELLAKAVAKNIDLTRQSGHNVIFASIAMRALHSHPEMVEPGFVRGWVKLLDQFDGAIPGRGFYGSDKGWKTGDKVAVSGEVDESLGYDDLEGMANATIDELIATASKNTKGFGGLFHLIDHAAALIEIENCGFSDLAQSGIPAHRQHVRLLRSLPVLEGDLIKAEKDPFTDEYWSVRESVQFSAWLTHRIKVLYGVSVLLNEADEEKRGPALAALRYLMA